MEISDIDQFVFHQGSRYIVETLIRRLKLDKKKVPLMIEKTGNTVSSSIPLILENSIQEPRVRNILIAGFGVGWSWGGMILTRK
jgi:3-oxoacyl-[acyl-carrier-protein] synthase-3